MTAFAAKLHESEPKFAPYAWTDLPGFVQSKPPDTWWTDVNFCQRALTDAAAVCQADALLVPLLEARVLEGIASREDGGSDFARAITDVREVQPSLDLVDQLVAVGRDTLGVLPTVAALEQVLTDVDREDVEDTLSDLGRAALDRGVGALAVRGSDMSEVRRTVEQLAPIANYFSAVVIALTPGKCWASDDRVTTELIDVGGPWPEHPPALVVTYQDVTTSSTASDARKWVTGRGTS